MKKRMLSMLLCLMIFFSVIPQSVYAAAVEITGFEELESSFKNFEIHMLDKPDLDTLTSSFPKQLKAYLANGTEVLLDVSWVCESDDYMNTDSYVYVFYPQWDTNEYVLSDSLDYYLDLPYIPVYFTENTGIMLLDDETATQTRTPAENKRIIYEFLTIEMGLNTAAACGVLANIQKESNFNPNAEGDKKDGVATSYGICQWHDTEEGKGRWSSLKAFCEENQYDWTTLEGQLYYLQYELSANNTSVLYNGKKIYNYLLGVSNLPEGAYDAAYYWCYYFEVPANKENVAKIRGVIAQNEYWPEYRGDVVSILPFSDVPSEDWFYGYVEYAFKHDIMNGMDATNFVPQGLLNRAQFAVILHRLEGAQRVEIENKFSDVISGEWYTNGILWANSKQIVLGYDDTTFGVFDNITREQMATMMYRYAQMKEYDVSKVADFETYDDADKISEYAIDALKWAVGNGIITGKDETTLDPSGSATRAECATIITRFMRIYNN